MTRLCFSSSHIVLPLCLTKPLKQRYGRRTPVRKYLCQSNYAILAALQRRQRWIYALNYMLNCGCHQKAWDHSGCTAIPFVAWRLDGKERLGPSKLQSQVLKRDSRAEDRLQKRMMVTESEIACGQRHNHQLLAGRGGSGFLCHHIQRCRLQLISVQSFDQCANIKSTFLFLPSSPLIQVLTMPGPHQQ